MLITVLLTSGMLVFPPGARGEQPDRATLDQARSLLQSGQPDRSLPLFRRVLKHQPENEPARFGLALALLFSTQGSPAGYRRGLGEAVIALESSISLLSSIPGESRAVALRLYYLGMARWYLGQGDLALAAFDRSFHLDPGLTASLFNSIRVAEELGRAEEALHRKQTYTRIATPGR